MEGNVSIEIAGERRPLQYGDVVLILPEVAHHVVIHDEEMPYQEIDVLARQRKENSLFTIGGKWNAETRKPSISI